jgi:hypothetical protein
VPVARFADRALWAGVREDRADRPAIFDFIPVLGLSGERLGEWAVCATCGWSSDDCPTDDLLNAALQQHADERHRGRIAKRKP